MAVRVRLRLTADSGNELISSAVLNGGFEIDRPHLLLPGTCAERLLGLDFRTRAHTEAMEAAGGIIDLLEPDDEIIGRVVTDVHEGRDVSFHILVSDADSEILVSDGGIDALGIRVESFVPGRWRFAEETTIRESAAPRHW